MARLCFVIYFVIRQSPAADPIFVMLIVHWSAMVCMAMRIIFSRKGVDSQAGKLSSAIIDGQIAPIPKGRSSHLSRRSSRMGGQLFFKILKSSRDRTLIWRISHTHCRDTRSRICSAVMSEAASNFTIYRSDKKILCVSLIKKI
jgi:hypothetical protein